MRWSHRIDHWVVGDYNNISRFPISHRSTNQTSLDAGPLKERKGCSNGWRQSNKKYHTWINGPLTRYVKLRVAHAPGMPGTFSLPPRVSNPDMHHGTYVTHVPWCMPGSLTGGFVWSRMHGKCSRHSRRMRNPQFYVSGKGPNVLALFWCNTIFHFIPYA